MVAALLSAGCSSEAGEPDALPSLPSTSTSPSAAPSSAVPASAQAETPQGAAAFARFFYEQVALGFQTQNPDLVRQISLPSCESCNRYVQSITSVREQDLRVEGGDFTILFAEAPSAETGGRARVDVAWNFAEVKYYDATGALVNTGPAVAGVEETMQLVRREGSWVVESLVQVGQR